MKVQVQVERAAKALREDRSIGAGGELRLTARGGLGITRT